MERHPRRPAPRLLAASARLPAAQQGAQVRHATKNNVPAIDPSNDMHSQSLASLYCLASLWIGIN